jgi:hypothetical protein
MKSLNYRHNKMIYYQKALLAAIIIGIAIIATALILHVLVPKAKTVAKLIAPQSGSNYSISNGFADVDLTKFRVMQNSTHFFIMFGAVNNILSI